MSHNLGFLGAGNMAQAIIGGLIRTGYAQHSIWASDPSQDALDSLQSHYPQVNTCTQNTSTLQHCNIIILAVKPQIMDQVCLSIKQSLAEKNTLVISIAAGITIQAFESWLGSHCSIVRCMPNTPALVQEGATALYANANVNAAQKQQANSILSAIGMSRWVNKESDLDIVTALSGSGPAYFFRIIEIMQSSAESLGLDQTLCKDLILQTALGAILMAKNEDVDISELRRRVTSPNGTTEAALNKFSECHLEKAIESGIRAAKIRSEEISKELFNIKP
jgi:pyrroline-5-carboxylate reductase